jgi:hypothetical protein
MGHKILAFLVCALPRTNSAEPWLPMDRGKACERFRHDHTTKKGGEHKTNFRYSTFVLEVAENPKWILFAAGWNFLTWLFYCGFPS